jgi:hypothetical protein
MSTAAMMQRIAEVSPRLKARIAGMFYLLTILGGSLALFLDGRLYSVADLIAGASYAAVTLLLYDIFKPVNRNPLFARGGLQHRGIHGWASGIASSGPGHRNDIFRILFPPDWLPHFQIDLAASNSECADGVCRFGLADFSVTAARKPSGPLQSRRRRNCTTIAVHVAPRDGREL